jgi:hypothetical protein
MVSAPLSPAVGRVHHPLWAKVSSLPRCDDRCLRPGPERVCSADARRAVDQQGRRFPTSSDVLVGLTTGEVHGDQVAGAWVLAGPGQRRVRRCVAENREGRSRWRSSSGSAGSAAPLPAVPSADLRQGGTVPSDPEEMAAGVKAGRRPPAGPTALTPARTAPPSPAGMSDTPRNATMSQDTC